MNGGYLGEFRAVTEAGRAGNALSAASCDPRYRASLLEALHNSGFLFIPRLLTPVFSNNRSLYLINNKTGILIADQRKDEYHEKN
ncbi:unnamed protein product, partial [Brenthis ino]